MRHPRRPNGSEHTEDDVLSKRLRQILMIVLLIALARGIRAARPALATVETPIVKGKTVTWRGGDNQAWSNPANWQDGIVPRPSNVVRFPAGAPDALMDSRFDGIIGGSAWKRVIRAP